jgi:hypothetical protein
MLAGAATGAIQTHVVMGVTLRFVISTALIVSKISSKQAEAPVGCAQPAIKINANTTTKAIR